MFILWEFYGFFFYNCVEKLLWFYLEIWIVVIEFFFILFRMRRIYFDMWIMLGRILFVIFVDVGIMFIVGNICMWMNNYLMNNMMYFVMV